MESNACSCNEAPKLIFACSGCADVGEISDRAARKLTREGVGKMFCLVGLGAHLNNFLMSTGAAGKILAIDGCPVDCTKKLIEHVGFENFVHLRVTDLGMEKGKSPATEERIHSVAAKGAELLAG